MKKNGNKVIGLHGDKTQHHRQDAIRKFTTGQIPILIATDIASRGLDFPRVSYVINFDLPNNIEDYIHRIGRTGRCGNTGYSISFLNEYNRPIIKDLFFFLKKNNQEIPNWFEIIFHNLKDFYNENQNYPINKNGNFMIGKKNFPSGKTAEFRQGISRHNYLNDMNNQNLIGGNKNNNQTVNKFPYVDNNYFNKNQISTLNNLFPIPFPINVPNLTIPLQMQIPYNVGLPINNFTNPYMNLNNQKLIYESMNQASNLNQNNNVNNYPEGFGSSTSSVNIRINHNQLNGFEEKNFVKTNEEYNSKINSDRPNMGWVEGIIQ